MENTHMKIINWRSVKIWQLESWFSFVKESTQETGNRKHQKEVHIRLTNETETRVQNYYCIE